MQDKKLEGNLAMIVSKTFSGLNMNALKYLIPLWMAPLTGVTLRVGFGAIAFWAVCFFIKPKSRTATKDKLQLFLLGALGIYGFMMFYLQGLKYTTPISSSLILALEPIWVFVTMVLFYKEKLTWMKTIGLFIGLGGAMLSMTSRRDPQYASDATLGDMLTLASSFIYALYLIFSGQFLKRIDNLTVIKWTFTGAFFSAIIVNIMTGFDARVLSQDIFSTPMLALIFVLIFPTFLSYFLLPIGLKYLNTTVVAMYGYIIILVAAVASYILGQDRFSWVQVISMLLLICGVYLVEKAESSQKKE